MLRPVSGRGWPLPVLPALSALLLWLKNFIAAMESTWQKLRQKYTRPGRATTFAQIAKKPGQKTGLKASYSPAGTTINVTVTTPMKTEDSFEFEGVKYQAIERKSCIGCAFEKYTYCHNFEDQPYCMASMRMDNRNVVWQIGEGV